MVILIIIIGFFIGMHKSDDSNNSSEDRADSTKTETVTKIDSTNVIVGDTLTLIDTTISKYKVKSKANLRETPKNGKIVVTLYKNAIFYVSKDTLRGAWVYGKTEDEKLGYISKDLLDFVE